MPYQKYTKEDIYIIRIVWFVLGMVVGLLYIVINYFLS